MIYSCSGTLKQLAFIAARQLYPIEVDDEVPDKEDIVNILNNNHLNSHFQNLAREVSLHKCTCLRSKTFKLCSSPFFCYAAPLPSVIM